MNFRTYSLMYVEACGSPPSQRFIQEPREIPTFHTFSSEWFERQRAEGRDGKGRAEKSRRDLQWVLSDHLLHVFAKRRLDQITVKDVDRYRLTEVQRGRLSVSSINKMLKTLAAILETAVEYELIDRNPARGRGADCRLPLPHAHGSAVPITSLRSSTLLASLTRMPDTVAASGERYWPLSPLPACASKRR